MSSYENLSNQDLVELYEEQKLILRTVSRWENVRFDILEDELNSQLYRTEEEIRKRICSGRMKIDKNF
jgi:hypothetical protein